MCLCCTSCTWASCAGDNRPPFWFASLRSSACAAPACRSARTTPGASCRSRRARAGATGPWRPGGRGAGAAGTGPCPEGRKDRRGRRQRSFSADSDGAGSNNNNAEGKPCRRWLRGTASPLERHRSLPYLHYCILYPNRRILLEARSTHVQVALQLRGCHQQVHGRGRGHQGRRAREHVAQDVHKVDHVLL